MRRPSFEGLDRLCLTCNTKLTNNNKPIEQWKEYESELYCPKCRQWKTGAIVDWTANGGNR